MRNEDIKALIERLEHKSSVFVAKDCAEAAKALSLLLDVKVTADDWNVRAKKYSLWASPEVQKALKAVEDA